jgi:F-type H+-transporting ATPase subunit delta
MAENVTLARPYAEAAFQLATSGNALAAWSDVLARLSAVAARPEMEECIGNPRLSPEQLARLCLDVAASDVKLTLSADQQNFVRVLADNDRLIVCPRSANFSTSSSTVTKASRMPRSTSAFALDDATLKTSLPSAMK